jgi:UDP-N-acetylmuramoyl-L-alanyl-D-glutamate--2,6-diaminopimelate ligase
VNKLDDILTAIEIIETKGSIDVEIESITFDSRLVIPGSLYVAISGIQTNGHQFIDNAIQAGAKAIVCEYLPSNIADEIAYIKVDSSRKALAFIAAEFFNHPSENIKLVGVTGTNGKTTIASILFNLYKELGYKVGLLSTIENKINDHIIEATHTTPDIIQINKLLIEMKNEGVNYCFMEISSHAIDQHRIDGLTFVGGIFTNLTHDHLDYHQNFKSYLNAKKKFFDGLAANAFALTNLDDKNGMVMLQNTKAEKHTYGLKGIADFNCKIIENQFDGLQLLIENHPVWFRLIGKFNAYNLMAVYATAVLLGEDKLEILTHLSKLETAEGRFDQLHSEEGIMVIIDYAHTPDALKNVLETISNIRNGNEQLITLVGAGGNRDKGKRPLMAQIACQKSDKVILTSDNPRDEEPDVIIEDMKAGLDPTEKRKVISITNRTEAIKTAIAIAQKGDIILLAGKGHEKYQLVKDEVFHLDEKKIIKEVLTIKN